LEWMKKVGGDVYCMCLLRVSQRLHFYNTSYLISELSLHPR
jgi:hypothetical protein